jgi:hypothetical protein
MNTTRPTFLRTARRHRKSRSKSTQFRRILGAGIAALVACAAQSHAATQLWLGNGADGNWSTMNNFSPRAKVAVARSGARSVA